MSMNKSCEGKKKKNNWGIITEDVKPKQSILNNTY